MNVESIGYRRTLAEWETLCRLLRLPAPAGLFLCDLSEEDCAEARRTLTEDGVLLPGGDSVYVDRLAALLLRQICEAEQSLSLRSAQGQLLLFAGPKLTVLVEANALAATLTPFPDPQYAREHLLAAGRRYAPPVVVEIRDPLAVIETGEAQTSEQAAQLLQKLFGLYQINRM